MNLKNERERKAGRDKEIKGGRETGFSERSYKFPSPTHPPHPPAPESHLESNMSACAHFFTYETSPDKVQQEILNKHLYSTFSMIFTDLTSVSIKTGLAKLV